MSRSIVSLLVLAGCGGAAEDGFLGFETGSPEELAFAEDRALATLFDEGGAARDAGVEAVEVLRVRVDDLAMAHTRVRQTVDGVPVWGGEAIVHLGQDGGLFAVTDDFVRDVRVETEPYYTADEAIDLAAEVYAGGWDAQTDDPEADLWAIRHDGVDHLAWRVQLNEMLGTADDALPVVFVDAHTGDAVWAYDNLQSATCSGSTNFYGTVSFDCHTDGTTWYTEDTSELFATYTYANTTSSLYYVSSTSSTFPAADAVDVNATEAYWGLQQSYTYYLTTFGRSGIDGANGPGTISSHGYSFVNARTSYSRNYVNASWSPTGKYFTFGDGDGVNAGAMTALDIAAHEYTHGVTQYEANLTYSGESGHLNESVSDVFGAMVERYALGASTDNYRMGEDTWTPATAGDALRYMADPAADGVSYDYYTSSIGSVDVHYGSGVPNLVFYLMAEGGTHPRGKSTVAVTGIGAADAAAIWYAALSNYMTSSTNFSGARTAMINAATATYGSGSAQVAAVQDAWAAVGVGASSSGGGGGGTTACTTTSYSGSVSKRGSAYAPSSSGTAVTATSQTVSLTGAAGTDFDLYLEGYSGGRWSTVASSVTRTSSSESIAYSGSAATYRVRVYAKSGSGSYALDWCK